jgi:hypothetical protein
MNEPVAGRPFMPGYGILPAHEGTGLLEWSWAVGQLTASHDYWLATASPDGPHVMPVWGVWLDEGLWFSSGLRSRKARDLAHDPRCALTTDDARSPVIVKGVAELAAGPDAIAAFNDAVNAKYDTDYSVDFYDPATNGVWSVAPTWAFGLLEDDFPGSPTRWRPADG